MAGKSTVAQLNVLLSLDSSRLTRGIRQAQGRISVFSKASGKAISGFANVATGAFAAVASQSANSLPTGCPNRQPHTALSVTAVPPFSNRSSKALRLLEVSPNASPVEGYTQRQDQR